MYKHFSRRPKEIEDAIIASWEPSKIHKNVFSKDETKQLINLFKKAPKAGSGVANYKMFDDSLNVSDFEHTLAKRRPNPGETATACSAPVSWDTGAKEILDPVLTKCIGDYKMIGGKFNITFIDFSIIYIFKIKIW